MIANFDRRSLLAGIAAAAMSSAAAPSARAAPRRRFFERIRLPIGLQCYTLGDEPKADLDATFARVAAIGYRDVELSQLYGRTPAQVKAAADRAGLKISCMHLAVTTRQMGGAGSLMLDSAPQRIADDLGAMGVRAAVMPIAPFPPDMKPRPGEGMMAMIPRAFAEAGADHWKRTAAILNERAALLKPLGITLGYHNHNFEFAPLGNTTGWDVLMRETDPSLVFIEADVGWVAAAGLDPVAFLRRWRGRVRWLHVKDLTSETVPNFALTMNPTEVGSGKQDWARILPEAKRAGVQHFYVEQEPPFAMPRMDAAAKSYAYLAGLRA
jgi:sugar phosphate isomerase/epimerase